MLKTRAGFTLAEVLVALTLTAVLGATVMGAFMSQSRFFDRQEKVGSARDVSRAGTTLLLTELRMIEGTEGVVAATNSSITLNVPYALGLYCNISATTMRISQLPVDSVVLANAAYSGYAYRSGNSYVYPTALPTLAPSPGNTSDCTGLTPSVAVLTPEGGRVLNVAGGTALTPGTPVFLYQTVSYTFKASVSVPGSLGLFRIVHDALPPTEEELVAPFAPGAQFRFYDDYSSTALTAVPSPLNSITGIEVTLDGLSERPNSDGTHESVSHVTSVFFKNR